MIMSNAYDSCCKTEVVPVDKGDTWSCVMATLPGPKHGTLADVDTASDVCPSLNFYRAEEP